MSSEFEGIGKILIYQNEKGDTKIDVYFEDEEKFFIAFEFEV